MLFIHVNTVINIIDDNIIASRQNRDIKKCFNWRDKLIVEIINVNKIVIDVFESIELRINPISDLQDQCFSSISFQFSTSSNGNLWRPRSVFLD